jgi:hypothetical protein
MGKRGPSSRPSSDRLDSFSRSTDTVICPVCAQPMQSRCLTRHLRVSHGQLQPEEVAALISKAIDDFESAQALGRAASHTRSDMPSDMQSGKTSTHAVACGARSFSSRLELFTHSFLFVHMSRRWRRCSSGTESS